MKKIFYCFALFLCVFSFEIKASESIAYSYFTNKISVDESLRRLKLVEESQKRKITNLESEISLLNRKLAIFGEKTEDEHEKIKVQRAQLNSVIQEKRAKLVDLNLDLIKISDEITNVNNSIFKQYVENMKRLDDFVFSKKYFVTAFKGIKKISYQVRDYFKDNVSKDDFSLAVFLKIIAGMVFVFFAFKAIMEARENLDRETLFNLRLWIKNLTYLLFPFGIYACSSFLFSFNFIINNLLISLCFMTTIFVFLRKNIENLKILTALSIVFGVHIFFENSIGVMNADKELSLLVYGVFVLIETAIGFVIFRQHKVLKWFFAFPILLIMSGYVALANIILFRTIMIYITFVLVTTFGFALKELLGVLKNKINKYISFDKASIILEIFIFILNSYIIFMAFLFAIGFRKSQILEVNRKIFFDMKFYNLNLSIMNISLSVLVFLSIILIVSLVNKRVDKGNLDESIKYSISVGFKYTGYIIAILVFLTMIGITFTSITIIAGALSLGIGFGLQNIVNNFVSGIIILFERPIKVGDWVVLKDGSQGNVRSISIRTITIETFQKAHIIVPNADILSSSFINWTRNQPFNRIEMVASVDLNTDPERVKEALMAVAKSHHKVLEIPAPQVIFTDWQDNGMIFELRCYVKDTGDRAITLSDLRYSMIEKFKEYGIKRSVPRSVVDFNNKKNKE